MQLDHATRTVSEFLKWCHQVGKTPIWPSREETPSEAAARRRRRRAKRHSQRQSKQPAELKLELCDVEGIIEVGLNTRYSVDGSDIFIDSSTWIFGDLKLGSRVKVNGHIEPSGRIAANKIIISI